MRSAAHLAQERRGSGRGQARRAVQLHHLGRLRQHGLRGARPRARCLRSSSANTCPSVRFSHTTYVHALYALSTAPEPVPLRPL
jgi:hypothetical protein